MDVTLTVDAIKAQLVASNPSAASYLQLISENEKKLIAEANLYRRLAQSLDIPSLLLQAVGATSLVSSYFVTSPSTNIVLSTATTFLSATLQAMSKYFNAGSKADDSEKQSKAWTIIRLSLLDALSRKDDTAIQACMEKVCAMLLASD
jgi:hypothetical protein